MGVSGVAASSFDPRPGYSPLSVLCPRRDPTCCCERWRTTGLYPQYLEVRFRTPVLITKINLMTTGILELCIHSSIGDDDGSQFDELTRHKFEEPPGRTSKRAEQVQQHVFAVPALRTAKLKFTIESGQTAV